LSKILNAYARTFIVFSVINLKPIAVIVPPTLKIASKVDAREGK